MVWGYVFGKTTARFQRTKPNLALLIPVGALPDFDLFTREPYGTLLGHHGISHSWVVILISLPFFYVFGARTLLGDCGCCSVISRNEQLLPYSVPVASVSRLWADRKWIVSGHRSRKTCVEFPFGLSFHSSKRRVFDQHSQKQISARNFSKFVLRGSVDEE